ncbi:MAG: hypothetical protein Hyperionvirus2_52 [Hyperionvirus sp.]|uniref:Uncharacterized protein n=1 Tax=Hyperionvirus sp. TaxID=2487770 RepID=A0A3G5A835_9VIRU|nr:MAG: hypothetical protein Hyperionvirus2_52 [Hyperionvirus sp.]
MAFDCDAVVVAVEADVDEYDRELERRRTVRMAELVASKAVLRADIVARHISMPEWAVSMLNEVDNASPLSLDHNLWVEARKCDIYKDVVGAHDRYLSNLREATKVGRFLGAMAKQTSAKDSRINGFIIAFLTLDEINHFNAVLISMVMKGMYIRNVDISRPPYRQIIVSHIKKQSHTIKGAIITVSDMHPMYLRALFKTRTQFANVVSLKTKQRSMLEKSASLVDFIDKFIAVKGGATGEKKTAVPAASIYERTLAVMDTFRMGFCPRGQETAERYELRRIVEGSEVPTPDVAAMCERYIRSYGLKAKNEALDFVPAFTAVKRAFGAFEAKPIVPVKTREVYVPPPQPDSVEEAKRLAIRNMLQPKQQPLSQQQRQRRNTHQNHVQKEPPPHQRNERDELFYLKFENVNDCHIVY